MLLLLLEGGAAGHMMHPYENPDLEFSKMMEIIRAAAGGFKGIDVTEKIDGQNVYIGYDIDKRDPLAIRNKAHSAEGGIGREKLRSYFTTDRTAAGKSPTPEYVVESFEEAMDDFDDAMEDLSKDELESLFRGPDGDPIFYNSEILNPKSPNVIDYDVKKLIIHRAGAAALKDGNLFKLDAADSERLAAAMTRILNQYSKEALPKVIVNNIMNLGGQISGLDADAASAEAELKKIIGQYNIADNETIADYVVAIVMEEGEHLGLTDEALQKFISAAMFFYEKGRQTKRNVKGVLSAMESDDKADVEGFLSNESGMRQFIKDALQPIEDVIHNFGVRLLGTIRSLYVTKHPQAIAKLQAKVGEVFAGDTPYSKKDLKLLKRAMVKMKGGDVLDTLSKEYKKAMQRITTDVEGIVFDFDGATYKFTGNFAPINQVLGISKYGRGAALSEQVERENPTTYALIAGGFKPPHKGHMEMVQHYADNPKVDKVMVFVGPKTRTCPSGKQIGAAASEAIWQMYINGAINGDKIKLQRGSTSPMKEFYNFIETAVPGSRIIPGASDKLDKGVPDYQKFMNAQQYAGEGVEILPADEHAFKTSPESVPLSATQFRQALDTGEGIEKFIPAGIDPSDILKAIEDNPCAPVKEHFIFKLIDNLMKPQKERILESINQLDEYGDQVIEVVFETKEDILEAFAAMDEDNDEEEIIDEISAMAIGSGAGYSLPIGDEQTKRNR